jgi:hypothetical protein
MYTLQQLFKDTVNVAGLFSTRLFKEDTIVIGQTLAFFPSYYPVG